MLDSILAALTAAQGTGDASGAKTHSRDGRPQDETGPGGWIWHEQVMVRRNIG